MVATVGSSPVPFVPPVSRPAAGADGDAPAVRLAQAYLDYASAVWRGDAASAQFGTHLGRFWDPSLTPAPGVSPAAETALGPGGHGLAWSAVGDEVWGCVVGAVGGYRIPRAAVAPLLDPPPDPRLAD